MMDLKKVNHILENLYNLRRDYKLISSDKSDDYHEEKNPGQSGLKIEIFDIGEDNIFLKVNYETDSYGGGEKISKLKFVSSTTKTVTVYEQL